MPLNEIQSNKQTNKGYCTYLQGAFFFSLMFMSHCSDFWEYAKKYTTQKKKKKKKASIQTTIANA